MTNELTVRNDVVQSLDDIQRIAKIFLYSGYFAVQGKSEQVGIAEIAVKIMAGREAGFAPYASAKGIHIIKGNPTFGGNLLAAAVKGSKKYDYRILQNDDTAVAIEFFERVAGKRESLGKSTFTAADAKKAGTQNMDKYPRNMLFNRAISNGVKWYCPDVLEGVTAYTPDEMGAEIDDNGDYIEVTAQVVDAGTGEVEQQPADRATFGHMHALGRELFGDDWRNGAGRDFVKQVTGKETTRGILQDEAEAVIEALEEYRDATPTVTVTVSDAEPLEY